MNKTFKITVDTQKTVQNPSFHVNTNDLRTVHLLMSVQSNGKPVNLEDAQVRIAVLKPDKKTVFQDVVVVDAASGLCEVILDSQAYVVPGEHTAELMIYFVGERVSVTGRFNYRAISGILSDETVESQNEYQAINKLVLDAETAAQNAKQSENNAKQAETNAVNAAAQLAQTIFNGQGTITNSESNGYFRGSYPFATVTFDGTQINTPNYDVLVTPISGDVGLIGDLVVYDKTRNGFKVKMTGSAKSVTFLWTVLNPNV